MKLSDHLFSWRPQGRWYGLFNHTFSAFWKWSHEYISIKIVYNCYNFDQENLSIFRNNFEIQRNQFNKMRKRIYYIHLTNYHFLLHHIIRTCDGQVNAFTKYDTFRCVWCVTDNIMGNNCTRNEQLDIDCVPSIAYHKWNGRFESHLIDTFAVDSICLLEINVLNPAHMEEEKNGKQTSKFYCSGQTNYDL